MAGEARAAALSFLSPFFVPSCVTPTTMSVKPLPVAPVHCPAALPCKRKNDGWMSDRRKMRSIGGGDASIGLKMSRPSPPPSPLSHTPKATEISANTRAPSAQGGTILVGAHARRGRERVSAARRKWPTAYGQGAGARPTSERQRRSGGELTRHAPGMPVTRLSMPAAAGSQAWAPGRGRRGGRRNSLVGASRAFCRPSLGPSPRV